MDRTQNEKKSIYFLTIILFASIFIFELVSWGKYLFLIVTIIIAIILSLSSGKIEFSFLFGAFQKRSLFIIIYCFASAMWAWDPDNAIQCGITIVEIIICYSFIYAYYVQKDNIRMLLSAIMWGAYIVSIYTIIYYGGINAITEASKASETRLTNSFSNVNELGLLSSIACILQLDEFFRKKKFKWSMLFIIPSVLVVAATQSRKAFLVLVIGVVFVIVLKNSGGFLSVESFFKVILLISIIALVLFALVKAGVFTGILERFTEGEENSFINIIYDPNTLRGTYKRVGWQQFLQNPVFGIGMGSSTMMINKAVGIVTYTHDNYIELLSCGGIVGFFAYYSIYIYLFKQIARYRKLDSDYADVCWVLLFVFMFIDTALVSFTSKERWIYLVLLFVEADRIDKKIHEDGTMYGDKKRGKYIL